jgi:HAD superfamily hydrolase (TIGR01484 family)
MLFLDLDDTIFQTKRKNSRGNIPATNPENPENISYMTEGQQLFTDMFLKQKNVKIVPVTARDQDQYNRTEISKHPKVTTAIMYFSAVISENGQPDLQWRAHIRNCYDGLKQSLPEVVERISDNIDPAVFKMHSVEDYYIVIKNRAGNKEQYILQNDELQKKLQAIIDDQYYIHYNSNNISVLPKFLDKKYAVEYLIKKYKPSLTIGAGDSLTDLNFMQVCDFMVIPGSSQINEQKLSQTSSSFPGGAHHSFSQPTPWPPPERGKLGEGDDWSSAQTGGKASSLSPFTSHFSPNRGEMGDL